MKERLQKVLARAGIASRRKAEEMISAGDVAVNGEVARIGAQVDPDLDDIRVRGLQVTVGTQRIYLALNKPRGYVTSLRSTHGEKTIMDLLPGESRLVPAGRLDKETSGLLLLTNDGEWANIVTHPRYGVEKEYLVIVTGSPSDHALATLRAGVTLPDGTVTAPARVQSQTSRDGRTRLSVTVVEGKKRQIRLMTAAVGHPAIDLQRVRVGPIQLGELREGSFRHLAPREVEEIVAYGRQGTSGTRHADGVADRDRRTRRGG